MSKYIVFYPELIDFRRHQSQFWSIFDSLEEANAQCPVGGVIVKALDITVKEGES